MYSIIDLEPHLAERIDKARKYASFIKAGRDIVTIDQAEMVLRYVISKHYNIPIFHEYFDKLTIDQLFFEAELITPEKKHTPESISEVAKNNQNEIDQMADEMEQEWSEGLSDNPVDSDLENDPIFLMAKQFMKTGKFTTDQSQPDYSGDIQSNTENIDEEEPDSDWQRTSMD